MVDVADLVHAADGAVWRAAFRGQIFAFYVSRCVIGQRDARITALLAAIMHQAVFADIEIA